MKRIQRYIIKKWLPISAGIVITAVCVRMAYIERGYMAYGGEWLVLPIILVGREVFEGCICSLRTLAEKEDYEPKRNRKHSRRF